MKIRIIKEGIYGQNPLKIGDEFTLAGHPPAGWAGFYEVVQDDPKKDAKAVTNPAKDDDRPALTGKNKAELLEIAANEGVEIEDGATNPEIVEAIEAGRKDAE